MKKTLLPIHILIIFLTVLTGWSLILWNSTDSLSWLLSFRNLALLALASFLVRLGIRIFIDESYRARNEHRIITLLILFLLFDIMIPWWAFVLLGAITELSQYFIRTPMGPLFNPAALGALILSLVGFLPSWWGVNPPPRFLLFGVEISVIAWVTAVGAGYVAYRYRKLTVAWSAALGFMVSYFVFFQQNPTYFILEGTLLFFICIMVCEPKTSPVVKKDQLIYGILIGVLAPLGLYLHLIEASLLALLLGNLYTGRRFLTSFFTPAKTPPTQTV